MESRAGLVKARRTVPAGAGYARFPSLGSRNSHRQKHRVRRRAPRLSSAQNGAWYDCSPSTHVEGAGQPNDPVDLVSFGQEKLCLVCLVHFVGLVILSLRYLMRPELNQPVLLLA